MRESETLIHLERDGFSVPIVAEVVFREGGLVLSFRPHAHTANNPAHGLAIAALEHWHTKLKAAGVAATIGQRTTMFTGTLVDYLCIPVTASMKKDAPVA